MHNSAFILGRTNMTEFANYTSQSMPNGFSIFVLRLIHTVTAYCNIRQGKRETEGTQQTHGELYGQLKTSLGIEVIQVLNLKMKQTRHGFHRAGSADKT